MARTNKYTSLNFNDIFDKNTSTSPATSTSSSRSPSSTALPHKSYSLSASSRLGHGGMLVLSRPSPKPQPQPQPQSQPQSQPPPPQAPNSIDFPAITSPELSKPLDSDSMISLRPQGKTGGSPSFQERENINNKVDVPSPKSNKFVPPHLRPGFVAREVPEFQKSKPGIYHRPGLAHGNYHDGRPKSGGGYHGYGDNGRPKSGGGYDRRMRGAPPSAAVESESRSSGSRPYSSG